MKAPTLTRAGPAARLPALGAPDVAMAAIMALPPKRGRLNILLRMAC
ncbi:hypothetical protein FHW94_000738 [Novosphingobium sp. SG720]|nr:hypothetical protein [Novosphingobium sp. SG720]